MLEILDSNIEEVKNQRSFLKAELDFGDSYRDLSDEAIAFLEQSDNAIQQSKDIKARVELFINNYRNSLLSASTTLSELDSIVNDFINDMGV